MDPLSGLLDPRARGAFILRSVLSPPWAIRIEDRAPLSLVAVVRGTATVTTDAGARSDLAVGDVAVLRGPAPYVFADSPRTPVQAVIGPDQTCRMVADARPLGWLGVRSWGNDPHGGTLLLIGTYHSPAEISRSLLAGLPELVVMRCGEWDDPLVRHLAREADLDAAGQDVVLDRLLDLVLIGALRAWLARADTRAPSWFTAHDDPIVGTALALIHERPGHPWSVASLAAEAGCSRATLARRFTDLVGEPPMAYLTAWRISHAADLLTRTDATLESVARAVGYSSAFALSAAFKRERGCSPRAYRTSVASG